jgi:hypothetical protein
MHLSFKWFSYFMLSATCFVSHVGLRQREALVDQQTMSVTFQNTAQGSQNTVLMMCSRWMVNHVTEER